MMPTYRDGQLLVGVKAFWLRGEPFRRGEVVMCRVGGEKLLKRIYALPGDEVVIFSLDDGFHVMVQAENYLRYYQLAEGIGHVDEIAERIEKETGIESRSTVLGHVQRGGSPTCKDRYYASIMGAYAADILCAGSSNRVVAYRHGEFVDYDIEEALAMQKSISEYEYEISRMLAI